MLYRSLDINNDSLSGEVNVQSISGGTAGDWGSRCLDICKTRGGNIYIAFSNDDVGVDTVGFHVNTQGGSTFSWTQLDHDNLFVTSAVFYQ